MSLQYLAGAGVYTTQGRGYNANSQLTSLNWTTAAGYGPTGAMQYNYSATQNDGQITQAVDTLSGETIVYQYDLLKRLTSAASTPIAGGVPAAWTQTFQYDGFSNLTAKVLNGTTTPISVDTTTNRLATGTAGYDLNGNMISGLTPLGAGVTYTYDVPNRLSSSALVSGGTEYYVYAPDNKRIYRLNANGVTEEWTFFGAQGEKLGVFSLGSGGFTPLRSNVYFAGKLVLDSNNAVFLDRVGSNRASGARFYPYGDEVTSTSNDREKFATYTRDSYTGLDYADQRFYASTYGGFNSPDPYMASGGPKDPGSWNRYSYTGGDPVNRFDPTGRMYCGVALASGDEDSDLDAGCSGGVDGEMLQYLKGCSPYIFAFGAEANSYGAPLPNCQNVGGYVVPVAAPAAPSCGDANGIPSSQYENDEIAVLFGEDSWTLGYQTSQVTQEDRWMLNGMANQALAYNQKPDQAGVEVSIQRGAYLGYGSGLVRLGTAISSGVGSSACQHFQEAEATFDSFWSAGGIFAPGYSRWVSNNARTQPARTDVTFAGTTFFLSLAQRAAAFSPRAQQPLPVSPGARR